MNIKNFKDSIDETILKRGYEYYRDGNIIETYDQGDGEYIFEIEGHDDYEVIVQISNSE